MEATIIILQSKEEEEIDDRAVPITTNELPPTKAPSEAIQKAIAALQIAYPQFNITHSTFTTTTEDEI